MALYNPDLPLYFLHVPKTAGTSVKAILENWFGAGFRAHYRNPTTGSLPQKHLISEQHSQVIYGHFNKERSFGVRDYYPEARQFITFLRAPWERAVSLLFFLHKRNRLNEGPFPATVQGLIDFLNAYESTIYDYFPAEMTPLNFKEYFEQYFLDIGTLETLEGSLRRQADILGKQFQPKQLGLMNATLRNLEIPEYLKDDFRARNQVEYQLYEFANAYGKAQYQSGLHSFND